MPTTKKTPDITHHLFRSEKNKVIAGVAGGLGEYFNIDPVIVRVVFVLLTFFGGAGIPLYLILWLVIPKESDLGENHKEVIRENADEIKTKAKEFTADLKTEQGRNNSKEIIGFILVILGLAFLLDNFGFYVSSFVWKLWPVLLIIFGYMILTKNERR